MRKTIPLLSLALAPGCLGAFFPPPLVGVQRNASTFNPAISVSSKDTSSFCETTPNVKSFSGFVSMSPASLAFVNGQPGFPVNTFYWFFESRRDPANAPLVLWLGGGPGFSGVASAVFENGPCYVNDDSNSTTLNPNSWNNVANIIYIDSPAMTGYSYDVLVNATVAALDPMLPITPAKSGDLPQPNNTLQVGTFGSQDPTQLSNSTGNVVPIIWTAMQAWLSSFPKYKPTNNRMSIWTESYGGRYGPLVADYFQQQNRAIANGTIKNGTAMAIDTLGIINGYTDPAIHAASYPTFVNNNTYGIQTVPPQVQASMQQNLTACLTAIDQCQEMTNTTDSTDAATNKTSDTFCSQAFLLCEKTVQKAYDATSNRSQDDIAHPTQDPFPPSFYVGFFNQAWVQQALGSPVNFTANSMTTLDAFIATGDLARDGARQAVGRLLDNGVQVVLLYGDRDYQVNWLGGEQVSLAVESQQSVAFHAAGYANMVASNGTNGGFTRQAGNFSFTRVFEAGHSVPAYQPGVALDIFTRAMGHRDIATGNISTSNGNFSTKGPSSCFDVKDAVPTMPLPLCYTWAIGLTCTPNQIEAIAAGTATVKNFIVVDPPASNNTSSATSSSASSSSSTAQATSAARHVTDPLRLTLAIGVLVTMLALA